MAGHANEDDGNDDKTVTLANAHCTAHGMAAVGKSPDGSVEVQYGTMTTTHSHVGEQRILEATVAPKAGMVPEDRQRCAVPNESAAAAAA